MKNDFSYLLKKQTFLLVIVSFSTNFLTNAMLSEFPQSDKTTADSKHMLNFGKKYGNILILNIKISYFFKKNLCLFLVYLMSIDKNLIKYKKGNFARQFFACISSSIINIEKVDWYHWYPMAIYNMFSSWDRIDNVFLY